MSDSDHELVPGTSEPVSIPQNEALSLIQYKKGKLHVEGVSLDALAKKVGTPFYVYSQKAVEATFDRAAEAMGPIGVRIHFAVKANYNQSVLAILAKKGSGADVTSIGELLRAVAAGIPAKRVTYSGAGKTPDELAQALDLGIYQFNVESSNELELLNSIALKKKKKAPVAIRINPDVDARTVAKITTGKKGNKFGIDIDKAMPVFERAAKLAGIDLVGIAIHIGSQLIEVEPFRAAYAKTVDFLKRLRAKGMAVPRVDLGGGLGVWYRNEEVEDWAAWADVIADAVRDIEVEVTIEPGRAMVCHAGVFVSRVTHMKQGSDRKFLILDAGMNDLARPSLYGSYHHIVPVAEPSRKAATAEYDIVGPICESTDTFALNRTLPVQKDGDLVAFLCAGAYGSTMSYTYNARPLAPEVLVKGSKFAVVRPRPTLKDIIKSEPKAEWLK